MNFQEAEKKVVLLQNQLKNGQITREQYVASVNQLRVTDSSGRWWQPDPGGAGWLFWDGTSWRKGSPPVQVPVQSGKPGPSSGSVSEFRDQMIDFKTFRQISKELPLAQRPQKWWDFFSILGGVIGAVIWFFYAIEVVDIITPLIIIALPVLLVMFRKNIDGMLQPLQPTRKKIPVMVLVGISIALPFLTAYIFYNFLGISEYSLIRLNMIIGVLVGYALIRNPEPSINLPQIPARGFSSMLVFIVLLCMIVVPVIADDCTRDPFRAEDCLRTGGFAEGIAGLATVAVVILVNGAEVVRTIYKTPKTSEDQEDKVFTVVVTTRDPSGNISTTLDMVNSPAISFFAHCEEVGKGRFPSGDDTIRFALMSAQEFLVLTDQGMKQGERCAQVSFRDPQPEGNLPDTADVMVSAGIGQNTVPATVTLSLKSGKYVLEAY
jgi:hypothetical protein